MEASETPEEEVSFDIGPIFRLRLAHSVQDVSHVLGMEPSYFFYVLQHTDDSLYYRNFKIPKKRGGYRLISAPKKGLGIAQTRLASILATARKPKDFVKGYVPGESFLTNAKYHERQKWILGLDIDNFYPSITFPRVRGLFLSRLFGFNERVATILARITTTKDGLPQGARTSPIIANLIAYNLDRTLVKIAIENKLRYTRYADDITFSSSHRKVPSDLIASWEPMFGDRTILLGRKLSGAIEASGFRLNDSKTRLKFSYERQEVTGLIVNKSANVRRADVSRLRMVIHSARVHGADNAAGVWLGAGSSAKDFWQHVCGWLAFIRQVRGRDDAVLAKLCKLAVVAGLQGPEWIERSADMVREFDVFLSHATEDKPRVSKLKDRLENIGVTVFFDTDSIKWGDSIVEKINHGLLKSRFFMPYLSETFAKKGWTNKELNSAITINAARKNRILPIRDESFSVGENYPLLNETVYKTWPSVGEDEFLHQLADEVLAMVEGERKRGGDFGS